MQKRCLLTGRKALSREFHGGPLPGETKWEEVMGADGGRCPDVELGRGVGSYGKTSSPR